MKGSSLYIALFIFQLAVGVSLAQEGDYYLTDHNPPSDLVDNLNFSIEQDQKGIMWIANRKGILQYDGVNWILIPTPSAIFSLTLDDANTIYAGGRNVIGRVTYNESNRLSFSILLAGPSVDDIISSINYEGKIFFLSESNLYYYDPVEDSVYSPLENPGYTFRGLFNYKNDLLISSEHSGLLRLEDQFQNIAKYPVFDSLSLGPGVRWISEYAGDENLTVLIDGDGFLHLSDDSGTRQLDFEDDGYLQSSVPMETRWVSATLMAVSTLSGGVVFINPAEGKIEKIVNYHTGLADNQVFAITSDIDNGIWVAHDYGLTRIAPLMPFRSYGNFPGLEGNILAVARFENEIYVGTNLGVYYLDQVEDYQEIEYYIRISQNNKEEDNKTQPARAARRPTAKSSEPAEQTQQTEAEPAGKKEKKGLFGFLKKKKNKNKSEDELAEPSQKQVTEPNQKTQEDQDLAQGKVKKGFLNRLFRGQKEADATKDEWQKRTRRELLSIQYVFKKVEEIPAKTEFLLPTNDFLITAGLSGIYEIRDHKAISITEEPVRHAYFSKANNLLFASTYDNDILSFSYDSGEWIPSNILEGLEDYIFQITDQENSMWLVSADSLYRIELESGELVDVDVFRINNPYFEETYAVTYDAKLYFVNSSGYFFYDPGQREILEDESMKEAWGLPERLFVGGSNNIWMFNGKEWHTLGEASFNRSSFDFLHVFPDIRQLFYSDENDRFWVVTTGNKIYEIAAPDESSFMTHHSIYLKEIRKQNNLLRPDPRLQIQLENSSLTFNFIQPDYSGLMGIEYHYRLVGLSKDWSEWGSNNNIITFSYLPAGQYTLEFETRDIFGAINSINPIGFRIIDPYWRRPWFYAIEVVFFSLLLYMSIRLNRASTRYRLLSRVLAFLTLILIIEFIQTVAEYKFETDTSPVIDFFIQVSIALVVLPFESLLRRAIFRSKAVETSLAGLSKTGNKTNNKKKIPETVSKRKTTTKKKTKKK